MPPVNLLIKPASSACNMNCKYCFYRDVSCHREEAFQGILSLETLESAVKGAMEYAEGSCSFLFQGGEPTLAGLDFYRQVVAMEQKYAKPGVKIYNAIQTNGYQLEEDWFPFFHENSFLVGVSLDGPAELHNLNRQDNAGKNTFNQVMRTITLLKRFQVEYSVLCVLTGRNARSIERIYHFYRKQGISRLQFIPCLEPLDKPRGETDYHLSVEAYGEFLVRIFDLWMQDLQKGDYVSIRHLDNWIRILLGGCPESCGMAGRCSIQFVVEGDGGVYPCDFYVLDSLRLGTVGQNSFKEMASSPIAEEFLQSSLEVPKECAACSFYPLCRNGCRRDRVSGMDGLPGQNYFCSALRHFFSKRGRELEQAAVYLSHFSPCI